MNVAQQLQPPTPQALDCRLAPLPVETRSVVDVRFEASATLPPLLERLGITLLLSAPRSGKLIVIAAPQGKLAISFLTFDRPMGIGVGEGVLAVGARNEIYFLRNAPIAGDVEPRGRYDGCYLARTSHLTGDIACHEIAWVNGELWAVNTWFSCLCVLHDRYSFAPRWRPPFITQLVPEDRCHLNGLALVDGQPKYVTALAETDVSQGWRAGKANGGCLIDIASGQTLVRGLCMPHSPRFALGQVYCLESGTGSLTAIDVSSGKVRTIATLPGFTRGLAIHGSLAFVGLSRVRHSSDTSVPVLAHPDLLHCGLAVVDLATGQIVEHLTIASPIDEIFDVQFLPGMRSPFLVGPFMEHDMGRPFLTLPSHG